MFLRAGTAQTIRFGPCLDAGDGVTEETALTLTQADMRLSKDGAAFAQKSAAGNATHDSDGWYSTTLSTTDTNLVGELILNVHQPANMLPVWQRYYVLHANTYDALFASTADAFDALGHVGVSSVEGNAINDQSMTSGATAKIRSVEGLNAMTASAAGTTTTLIDSSLTEADTGHHVGALIEFTSGANIGSVRRITAFTPGTDTLTFSPAVGTATANLDGYNILPGAVSDVYLFQGTDVVMTGGIPDMNVARWKGDVVPTPAATGVPDVNVTHYEDIAVLSDGAGSPRVEVNSVLNGAIGQIQGIPGLHALTASAAGTTTTIIDSALTQTGAAHFTGALILFKSGTNNGAVRRVTGFDPGTDTLTFAPALDTATANLDSFALLAGAVSDVRVWDGTAIATPNAAGIPIVDTERFNGTSLSESVAGVPWVDVQYIDGGVVPTPAVTGVPDVNVTHWRDSAPAVLSGTAVEARIVQSAGDSIGAGALSASAIQQIHSIPGFDGLFTSAVGTTTTLIDSSLTQADDHWNGCHVLFVGGTLDGQVRLITDFDDASNTMTFTPAAEIAVPSVQQFAILPAAGADVRQWDGGALPTLPESPKINTALSDIPFLMVDATDHVTPETGLTVTGERSLDGGAFAAVSGSISELSDGMYSFDAAAADMNGAICIFRFSATGAADTFMTIRTAP